MINILYTIIIYPITQIIEFVFVFAQKLFKETGLSIMCVSGAVSLLCLPLYMVAESWQERERHVQKRLAAKTAKIKAVFKGDERYMILSTYYRQNHYHPVYALRSTFGLLIQIPFFIAAYSYLSHLDALQGASFLFIGDLGKSDKLLPFAGGINLLPVLMTLINCAAGAVYSKGLSLKEKLQLYAMSLVFLVLLYNSPSGLVLYWTLNNVFSLAKNAYLKIVFPKKHLLLFGLISAAALCMAYYTLFIHHGSPKVRALIVILSVMAGIIPWLVQFLKGPVQNIGRRNWTPGESLFLFVCSSLILWTATGLFLPSMLIGASPQEFSYIDDIASPLVFVFTTAVQAFGLCVFWPVVVYALFSGKIKKLFSITAFIIAVSALCNIFIFPGNYGLISKDLTFAGTVSHSLKEIGVNTGVLALIAPVLIIVYLRGLKKTLSFLSVTLCIALAAFSVKTIWFINGEFKKLSAYYTVEPETNENIEPVLQLSKTGKNVVVIMLDMAASVFIPSIFEESPELYQQYDGFTWFPNTVTFNGWTMGGAFPVFGGYEYTPEGMNRRTDVSLSDKRNEALLLMPKIFAQSGFSVTVTDPPFADGNWIPDLRIYDNIGNVSAHITDGVYTDRWLKHNNINLPPHSAVLKRNILWYAIFRETPLAFRQPVYFTGSWCAPFSGYRMRLFLNGYAVLDFLQRLTGFEPQTDKAAVFMVNNTTHENWFVQAPEYRPRLNVTDYGASGFSKEVWYHVNAAAIKRLSAYFDFLKAHNVYDNTRIILVSDHGTLDTSFVTKTGLPFHVDQFNPVLMVKDFNEKGVMKTDMTLMSNADVPSLAASGVIENPVNPFTGNALTGGHKNNPLPILTQRVLQKNENELYLDSQNTWYVRDNIFDEKNWNRTDTAP